MKVSSPVGEFPFELERLRRNGAQLSLEGRMGAWPARVEVGPHDGARLLRVLGGSVVAPVLGVLLIGGVGRHLMRRRS